MSSSNHEFKDILKRSWFMVGIIISILIAELYPTLGKTGGILQPEWTAKYLAVAIIFLTSGLTLSLHELLHATTSYKIHLFIQIFTFLVIPFVIFVINGGLRMIGVNEWILKGLTTVSCMPPPVSSAVILTKAVGGNEAGAIFNSVLGSFLGIIITPLALLLFLGSTALVSMLNSLVFLGQTVLIPLLLGLLLRHFKIVKSVQLPLSTIGQCSLLFIIYTTFCDVFDSHDTPMNASDVLITVVLVVVIQIGFMYVSFHSSQYLGYFRPSDVVAITFCSTHKSLTLGITILRILFSGYAHFSQITLPLLVYHPIQMMLGSLMVAPFKKWLYYNSSRLAMPP